MEMWENWSSTFYFKCHIAVNYYKCIGICRSIIVRICRRRNAKAYFIFSTPNCKLSNQLTATSLTNVRSSDILSDQPIALALMHWEAPARLIYSEKIAEAGVEQI